MWSKLPKGVFGHGAEFFDVLFAIEWAGLVLFVPAVVSGALTAEKERNTLQLLFLTKLGPWTILLEKLLSRLVPVATFLLVSLPLLFIAYLWGGLTQSDVGLAIAELALVVFELASIALFCSAFCATSASAFILSYVITALVFLCPFLIVLTLLFLNWWSRLVGAGDLTLVLLANAPEHRDTVLTFLTSTLGINLAWLFDQRFAPGVVRPVSYRAPAVRDPSDRGRDLSACGAAGGRESGRAAVETPHPPALCVARSHVHAAQRSVRERHPAHVPRQRHSRGKPDRLARKEAGKPGSGQLSDSSPGACSSRRSCAFP